MLFALLLSFPAEAYRSTGAAWTPDDSCDSSEGLLVRCWEMDDDVEDSIPEGYQLTATQAGWDAWEESAQCAAIGNEFMGSSGLADPAFTDGGTKVYFDDPGDDLAPGVLGASYSSPNGGSVIWNGQRYYSIGDSNIVFNDNVDWATDEDIEAGDCNGETSLVGVATHEVGHSWGLGHSCEESEACSDPLLRDAAMFWSVGPCDLGQSDLNEDDIASITTIYGPSVVINGAAIGTEDTRRGAAPLEICFTATVGGDETVSVISQSWDFGDGTQSDEFDPCHTYTSVGQFSVNTDVVIESDVCEATSVTSTQVGYVIACDVPKPAADANGFFTLGIDELSDGLTVTSTNYTDVSTYGCVDTIQWEVFKGSSAADMTDANRVDFNGDEPGGDIVGAWAPKFNMPAAGSYVVLMNVGGPAGVAASFSSINVGSGGGGCATVPTPVAAAGLLGLAGLVGRRRRS